MEVKVNIANDFQRALARTVARHAPTRLRAFPGLPGFLRESVAGRVSRSAGIRTLFVPSNGKSFVGPDGNLSLHRILVPVAETPDPDDAAEIATRAAELVYSQSRGRKNQKSGYLLL